jgi:cytoskeleton protein RodZ
MLENIGDALRAAREARGWSLEEVERVVHIRAKYLAALEAGDLNAMPSQLQARGFLRNYAQHLGLKPDQVLGQLDEALKPAKRGLLSFGSRSESPAVETVTVRTGRGGRTNVGPTSPLAGIRRLRRLFTPDLIIAFVAVVAVVGFLIWGGTRLAATVLNPSAITPTAQVLGPTGTPTPTLISNITPTASPPPPGLSFNNVQLSLVVEKRTYARVSVDGAVKFEGILLPGAKQDFVGQSVVEVTTGDGASIRVLLNEQDMGLMGGVGEVVTRQFLPSGVVTVTATITLTPSETLPPSETPTPTTPASETPTLTPSKTKRP